MHQSRSSRRVELPETLTSGGTIVFGDSPGSGLPVLEKVDRRRYEREQMDQRLHRIHNRNYYAVQLKVAASLPSGWSELMAVHFTG